MQILGHTSHISDAQQPHVATVLFRAEGELSNAEEGSSALIFKNIPRSSNRPRLLSPWNSCNDLL